jgi:hypothetical protein
MQVLVEYKDWEALVGLGLQHPGEHGQHLEAALLELVLAADAEPSNGIEQHIQTMLAAVAADDALRDIFTPLAVIGVLQRSKTLPLEIAKDFLRDHMRVQQEKALFNESRIGELQAEREGLEREIQDKRTKPLVRFHMPSCG